MIKEYQKTAQTSMNTGAGRLALRVEGERFFLELARPTFYNLIHEKTNKVVRVIPVWASCADIARHCMEAIKEGL